jgi:hypothetical protein
MNSFDIWDTLIGRRLFDDARRRHGLPVPGNTPLRVLALELEQCFPIAENVARVAPDDLLVSDYDLPTIIGPLVQQVTGLHNKIIVTQDGKEHDWIWAQLPKLAEHTGDNARCDGTCDRHGIKFNHTILTRFTPAEESVAGGMPMLARLMREVRLTTWAADPTERQFQLLQSQANLPMLFAASVLLHRRMAGFNRVLMSSRDCWLWHKLFTALHLGAYEAVYFYTSRYTRYWPSKTYQDYFDKLQPALTVDLCGFGNSLKYALKGAPALLLIGYKGRCVADRLVDGWIDEATNFARHAMVTDVDALGNPVYANPLGADWENMRAIAVMHEAFLKAVALVPLYDFALDVNASDEVLHTVLSEALARFGEYAPALGTLAEFRKAEAKATAELIGSQGTLPEGVTV